MAKLEDLFVTYKSVRAKQKAKKNSFIPDFSNMGLFKNYFNLYYPTTKWNTSTYTGFDDYTISEKEPEEQDTEEEKKKIRAQQFSSYLEGEQPTISWTKLSNNTYYVKSNRSNQQLGNLPEVLDFILKRNNINAIIVSGYRDTRRYTGDNSNHLYGDAVDIIPKTSNGSKPTEQDFKNLKRELCNNEEFMQFMADNNLGIIEEVTEKDQHKYRATGANFHIGPDKKALEDWKNNGWLDAYRRLTS